MSPSVVLSLMILWTESTTPASVLLYPSQQACLREAQALRLAARQHVVCLERTVELQALADMERGVVPGIAWERDANDPAAPPYMVFKKAEQH